MTAEIDSGGARARTAPRLTVVDYGAGNLVSIEQALTRVGATVTVARDPSGLEGAEALVVPGVGAAGPAMERLAAAGLVDPIRAWIAAGRPYVGICLGLQLLFDGSDEDGATTFGVLAGRTTRLEDAPTLPHIGWNQVELERAHPAFAGIAPGADFYFVHSYAGTPAGADAAAAVLARTTHGRSFVSAVARDNLLGVQFHPERSGSDGLRLLSNAVDLVSRHAWPGTRCDTGLRLMLRIRVIPCLDVADGRVVKGTRFVDLVDEGDPPELAGRYAAEGADELVFLDISAAPEGRGTLLDIVERTARRAFIPLTVGGGVRSVDDMRAVLRAGADKVGLNTAAVADPGLITACATQFGRQAVVVAIDARRRTTDDGWDVVVKGGRETTALDAAAWAEQAAELGAGELLVTSIDRDGTRSGYDTALLRAIADRVEVPIIASGGAAGPADFVAAVQDGGADAVLAASIFHRRIHSIAEIKQAMAEAGLSVRAIAGTAA